ncbi:MAG TPA: methyltransferase domain-containing protein [Acidobacteriota bacterium]|nr:methyltransferase domain-containing protein [Acidobacteriota bacterium]
MQTEWDYTELAESYLKRPPYSEAVIEAFLRKAGIAPDMKVCDIGAGTANLTLSLLQWGLHVVAVEPNEAMRRLGMKRTQTESNVCWHESCGESTALPSGHFDAVTFGSSFNVVDRRRALVETARILKSGGWFACLWNFRDLRNPLQRAIEEIIQAYLPDYAYGIRRENQESVIKESGLFCSIRRIDGDILHRMTQADCLEAWRSHATLRRQAGDEFEIILADIGRALQRTKLRVIEVPYTTRLWMAQKAC